MERLIPLRESQRNSYVIQCNYEKWIATNFDFQKVLAEIPGVALEIGGPTYCGYANIFGENCYANRLPTGQEIFISNIDFNEDIPQNVNPEDFTKEDLEYFKAKSIRKDLSLLCNGAQLPIVDKSLGAILFSHLYMSPFPGSLCSRVMKEAFRTLRPNGLLIVQAVEEKDIVFAHTMGFIPKIVYTPEIPLRGFDVVFLLE